eukprot:scaffold62023_cov19-Tisochrysis_lutea.AAC.1
MSYQPECRQQGRASAGPPEPPLCSKAVQVLGRLNRPFPGKTPACIKVVDFANSANEIRSAFEDHLGVITHCPSAGSHVAKEEVSSKRGCT